MAPRRHECSARDSARASHENVTCAREKAVVIETGSAQRGDMRTTGTARAGSVALRLTAAMALGGCYSGLGAGGAGGGGGDAGDGTADDGGSGADDGDDTGVPSCADPSVGITDLRRLTASQYNHTVRDLLGITDDVAVDFSPDERIGPFHSNVAAPVGDLQVEQYMDAAEEVASMSIEDLGSLLPCDPTAAGEDECAAQFIAAFAPKAYRRPLAADEITALQQVYADGRAQGDFTNGIRLVVQGILQSPFFLYHVESGQGAVADGTMVALTDHEIAARLSYFLWDTMPDDTLRAAAEAGELQTVAGLHEQVDRMLADPKAREGIGTFHQQWFGVDEVDRAEKNADYFPSFSPALAAAMKQETADFANYVVLDGDAKLETLLTAEFTLTDDPDLLALYGATLPPGHTPGDPIDLPAGQRSGLLTQAAVMTKHAHVDQTSPVHRGKLVRENLLCQLLPPPPPNVNNTPPTVDPDATTRERFEQHSADPECAACHKLMDPLGLTFENYDGVGAWRTMEGVNPIDASGEIIGSDVDGTVSNAVDLANRLVGSEEVHQCVTRQWFRFAFGRAEKPEDACTNDNLDQVFADSGHDVRALIKQLVVSDAFRNRRAEAATALPGTEDDR